MHECVSPPGHHWLFGSITTLIVSSSGSRQHRMHQLGVPGAPTSRSAAADHCCKNM